MKTMKLKHFICALPFLATACSDDDDTAMSIRKTSRSVDARKKGQTVMIRP